MPVITIDNQEYSVKEGDNLLQACLGLGLDLPYFCWHPDMGSIGACRQCAVVQYQNTEDYRAGSRGRIVMGCMTQVTDGAIFSLNGDKASEFRKTIVESLMLNHPHDCPVCAEGGECHLQDMTVMTGHRDRHYRGKKNTHRNQYLGPLIHHEMNRCITCYRCTRYYNNYAGGKDLAAMAAHDHVYFGRHQEGVLESEFAGNLVEVCPTGVFTDKSLVNDYSRKWDLQSAPSVCTHCAVGCNTLPGERYGKLKRVHNRYNDEVNGYFLCDRGRFGAKFVNSDKRINNPGLRDEHGRYNIIDPHQALHQLVEACQGDNNIAAIGSPRASVEANFLLKTLAGEQHYSPGFNAQEQSLAQLALSLQQHSAATIPSIKDIECADAIFILGEDLTHSAPRIALALRQSVRNKAYALAAELKLQPWQDAAVRNLAQDQRSPLFVAAVTDTRLDDIAEQCHHLAPDDIARLGYAVAEQISGKANASDEPANTIAQALLSAQRPLIIAGSSCGNAAIMQAAAAIADALALRKNENAGNSMLCLTLPEANSLGQAMLSPNEAPSIEALAERAYKIDTLIVLENDLFRRAPAAVVDKLLQSVTTLIVLDSLETPTLATSQLALPAASVAESEGTIVSLEGRAQRYFPVSECQGERRASWAWLLACLKELGHPEAANIHRFDDITLACSAAQPMLKGITLAAPDHFYRNAGVKIPRQPQRYSGRTAMRANVSVHEPKQTEDDETALAYTMEGLNRHQPGSLLPFVWSPGWNSNQSLHKFQTETGGPLKGGTAGKRLLDNRQNNNNQQKNSQQAVATTAPAAFQASAGQWLLVPRQRIFGSDELSSYSDNLAELLSDASIEINSADASLLQVKNGDGLSLGENLACLRVVINNTIPQGCAAYSVGIAGTFNLTLGQRVSLQKASDWQRPKQADVIASDGGAHV
ncbi:NADH-quinone oxidoreductase subunit NuoG [Dasania sp. GY-MA-18]|uniref:NADH-quinone oxidoreductase subunit G n=1 Tax=Dasania phycosphaerae TaxID=2950436 RepID=A0A9J6RNS4_9GAMM|nr:MULTISPECIES: NADH-quinone oxidoreductase subunit NuoG [Dasania]MCR8923722.1 NADH-quinone oxidoreductase subunit NuoG [Dasania sp. GY-MA-18]MCZ0866156.1 NADH-quinone oxidoreductase subunit NuoG [Dasania phycosphaerae]MCZ0869880.1 NADH-quinone oxidoreductase subunit NuoG [Dasania phycosphaerae]